MSAARENCAMILGANEELDVDYQQSLLKLIDDIRPECLASTSYARYIRRLADQTRKALQHCGVSLLLLVQAVKDCQTSCFKRDVLLEILDKTIRDREIQSAILLDAFAADDNVQQGPWRETANALVALPDLVSNCGALNKYPSFKPDSFHSQLLSELWKSIDKLHQGSETTNPTNKQRKYFYIQLMGRIAATGYHQLVWQLITSRAIREDRAHVKSFLSELFNIPLETDTRIAARFESFIEPLYLPIFFYMKPSAASGQLIKSLLGDGIMRHDSLAYVLCNKWLLQTNYTQSRQRQRVILFNILAYLGSLVDSRRCDEDNEDDDAAAARRARDAVGESDILIKTLVEIASSWSNATKVLFRVHEHNRLVSCAFVVALRYSLELDRRHLVGRARDIQAKVMQGFPAYLNGASSVQRNLAMCLGELILPKIHELVEESLQAGAGQQGSRQLERQQPVKLDFDFELDDDCKEIRDLFLCDIETLFKDYQDDEPAGGSSEHVVPAEKPPGEGLSRESKQTATVSGRPSKRAVIEMDDDDDLIPYTDQTSADSLDTDEPGEDTSSAPIYLRDCISGLAENTNPNYVRLCLIKAGELTNQLSALQPDRDDTAAVRDMAVELAQTLLYLDNQFNLDEFDGHRMSAMSGLCVAAPDLVAKYLLDEFNGTNRNIRHQLDILQALVESAPILAHRAGTKPSETTDNFRQPQKGNSIGGGGGGGQLVNGFVKYASLYFYGIMHRFSRDLRTTVISVVRSNLTADNDDSYLLSRILLSISKIIGYVDQQPIACKLSNDLLDMLTVFRGHPDTGVRQALISCLRVIRDCTPSVYFEQQLHDKMVKLFGVWLANE